MSSELKELPQDLREKFAANQVELEDLHSYRGYQAIYFEKLDLPSHRIEHIQLRHLSFPESIFNGSTFSDVKFYSTEFSNAKLIDCTILDSVFLLAQLHNAKLMEIKIKKSRLSRVDFRSADLTNSVFQDCKITATNFNQSILKDSTIINSELTNCELSEAHDLKIFQLAGCDLTNTKLPPSIAKFEGLGTIEEATKSTRKIFNLLLTFCLYSLIAIFAKKIQGMESNAATIGLPIIQVNVQLEWFLYITPIAALLLFIIFHLDLMRIWEEVADLPAVFPDGYPVDRKIYPWILLCIVRKYITLLKERNALFWLKFICAFVGIFLLTPLYYIATMTVLTFNY